jgi:hypothetical protein
MRDLHLFFESFTPAEISQLSGDSGRSLKIDKTVLYKLYKRLTAGVAAARRCAHDAGSL